MYCFYVFVLPLLRLCRLLYDIAAIIGYAVLVSLCKAAWLTPKARWPLQKMLGNPATFQDWFNDSISQFSFLKVRLTVL